MKPKVTILTSLLLLSFTMNLHAQTDSTDAGRNLKKQSKNVEMVKVNQQLPRNFIKLNLSGILMKNYALQYERVLNRKISVALQYRIMPVSSIPFKSTVQKIVGDKDPNIKKIIDDFKMSNFAITPEIRFYLSKKGFGRGFYIAPFYRYASFTSNELNVFYTDENNEEQSIKMSGKLTSNTGGILMGVQKPLGRNVVLDISFFGPHYGSGKGDFNGTTSKALTPGEQNDLKQRLEDIDIPLTNKTVNVNANGASLKLDGPWAGYRFAISLGARF
jgi:hypothetical protein